MNVIFLYANNERLKKYLTNLHRTPQCFKILTFNNNKNLQSLSNGIILIPN